MSFLATDGTMGFPFFINKDLGDNLISHLTKELYCSTTKNNKEYLIIAESLINILCPFINRQKPGEGSIYSPVGDGIFNYQIVF